MGTKSTKNEFASSAWLYRLHVSVFLEQSM